MTTRASERLVWAAERLSVRPAQTLLEVGCGHGVLASLVCARLTTGKLVAVDRSATMVNLARKRNREHEDAGRLELHAADLLTAPLTEARFDTVYAVNVDLLRSEQPPELPRLRALLAPRGQLLLMMQGPTPPKVQAFATQTPVRLTAGGFRVEQVLQAKVGTLPVACVVARGG
jgi:cyclopropane fatty-acyl-phospholipid synthase-like methyltransferase